MLSVYGLLDLRQLSVVATGSTALALDSLEYDDTRLGLLIGTVQVEQAIVGTGVVTDFDPLDLSGFHFFLLLRVQSTHRLLVLLVDFLIRLNHFQRRAICPVIGVSRVIATHRRCRC